MRYKNPIKHTDIHKCIHAYTYSEVTFNKCIFEKHDTLKRNILLWAPLLVGTLRMDLCIVNDIVSCGEQNNGNRSDF